MNIGRNVFIAVVLFSSSARAEDDAGVCPTTALTRDVAIKLKANAESMMKIASGPLDRYETLDTMKKVPESVRSAVVTVQCAYPVFSPKELTEARAFVVRAVKWARDDEVRLIAETKARVAIVLPLCEATWRLENAKASIAQEKANPSGVVNLRTLHLAGVDAQNSQLVINNLAPQFAAFRHHPFTSWRLEGVCVADVNNSKE